MTIQYLNSAMFLPEVNPSQWITAAVQDCPGGHYAVNEDGSILSVQPDGSVSSRPAGSPVGAWETFQLDSVINVLHFTIQGVPYAVVYRGA